MTYVLRIVNVDEEEARTIPVEELGSAELEAAAGAADVEIETGGLSVSQNVQYFCLESCIFIS